MNARRSLNTVLVALLFITAFAAPALPTTAYVGISESTARTNNEVTAAATTVTLNPSSGPVGTLVSVTGTGWPYPYDEVEMCYITGCNNSIFLVVDGSGNFVTEFTVPDVVEGDYPVTFDSYADPSFAVDLIFTVTQVTPPNPEFDAYPQGGYAPLTVSFHIVDSSNLTSCEWNFGDGSGDNVCDDYHDHTYVNAGSYSVELTVWGPGGSDVMFRSNYINVSPPPVSTYSISGAVRTSTGSGIQGVSVSIPGINSTTGSNGLYSLCCVVAGQYEVTPNKSGFNFNPPATLVEVNSNVTGINFVGTSTGGGYDNGFRPYPNGYGFDNSSLLFPPYLYSSDDLRALFGDEAVCSFEPLGGCYNKKTAETWSSITVPFFKRSAFVEGYCDGMAVMSLKYFEQSGGTYNTYGLSWNDAKKLVTDYGLLQYTSVTHEAIASARSQVPAVVLDKLKVSLAAGFPDPDPYVIHIFPPNRTNGHSLVPYRLTDLGGGKWNVWVYDPNYSGEASHYIVVDTNNNGTWEYIGTFGKWTGDGNPLQTEHTMFVVKISKYQAVQTGLCPWCRPALGTTPTGQVFLAGGGHLLINDTSNGQSIGYVGNQFSNQIPGAYAIPVFGSGLTPEEPTYYLPLDRYYNIQLDGSTLTQSKDVSVREFGPLFAAGVDTILTPSSQNLLTIANDGSELHYSPNQPGQAKMILASDADPTASYEFDVDMTLDGGQELTIANDVANHQLVVVELGSVHDTYSVKLTRVDQSGEHVFLHTGIPITGGDIHRLDYGTWNGQGSMILEIDYGNGTVDTVNLDNQYSSSSYSVYLPLVQK